MTRHLLQLAALATLASPALAGDPTYSYVDLGTLGGSSSAAFGLNESRQVVGWATIPGCTTALGAPCRRAFLWEDGVMTDLGVLAGDEDSVARAINESGLIVGTSESDILFGSGIFHGFVYDGAMTALPDLGQGQSFALDVNDAGTIAGHTQDPTLFRDRAVTWSGGAIKNVGASEPHESNRAVAIDESGHLAGFAWNLFSPNDAVVYAQSQWSTIGGTSGPFQNAEAKDLNDTGLVVGLQAFPSGAWHAALWTLNPPSVIDAGVLPGHEYGELYGVNNAGQAVGRTYDDSDVWDSRAVLYDGGKLIDLNDLLPAGVDGVLFEAQEVNERGDIVGTNLVDGEFRGFLMIRNDDPWSDLGLGMAGVWGVPVLEATGTLCAGDPLTVTLNNAALSSAAYLVVGLARLDLPFKGGVLVPAFEAPLGLLLGLTTDSSGSLVIDETWPGGIPAGTELFMQVWVKEFTVSGFAASNAIMGLVP